MGELLWEKQLVLASSHPGVDVQQCCTSITAEGRHPKAFISRPHQENGVANTGREAPLVAPVPNSYWPIFLFGSAFNTAFAPQFGEARSFEVRMLRLWLIFAAGLPGFFLGQWTTALPVNRGARECPDRSMCDFLSVPAIWEHLGQHPTYQSLDPCCELRDYVTEVLSSPEEPVSAQATQHGILFLGDSVDRHQLAVICEDDLRRPIGAYATNSYWACKRGPFSFHLQAMIGVHPTGPYLWT